MSGCRSIHQNILQAPFCRESVEHRNKSAEWGSPWNSRRGEVRSLTFRMYVRFKARGQRLNDIYNHIILTSSAESLRAVLSCSHHDRDMYDIVNELQRIKKPLNSNRSALTCSLRVLLKSQRTLRYPLQSAFPAPGLNNSFISTS